MDEQAAEQINHLFRATDSRVWELIEPEQHAPQDSVMIQDADGTSVAYARPTGGDVAAV
jgi:hypothetical protein